MNHIAYHLKDIYFNKKSGLLVFKHKDIKKTLCFQKGNLVFANTNQPEEKLGTALYKLGKISKKEYSKIDQYIKPGRLFGESLTEMGLISKKDLYEALIHQMKEITLNFFPFFDGEFVFEAIETFIDEGLELKISIPFLIEDGIRQMKYSPSLKQFMEKKIPFPKGNVCLYLLEEEEKEILDMIDGESSAKEILSSTGRSPQMFWKSLYLFYCLDLIDIREEEKEKKEKKEEAKEAPSIKEKERLAEVDALLEKLPTLDYYEILNVSKSASEDEIKKAYFDLARKYHPDSFDRDLPQKSRKKIEDVFAHITKAYQNLIDIEKRQEYDSQVRLRPEEGEQDFSKKADVKFRQAKTLFNEGRYEDALILLEEAIKLKRNRGRYFLLLALTESKIPSFRWKAEKDFLEAIELEPWNSEGYVGLGKYYKQEGLSVKAKKQFEKALEIDPDHSIAIKELSVPSEEKKKKDKWMFFVDFFRKIKKRK